MERPISMRDLDPEKIANVLVRLAVASHVMGHKALRYTALDYLAPHGDEGHLSPEARFVIALFCYPAKEVLIKEEAWAAHSAGAAHMLDA